MQNPNLQPNKVATHNLCESCHSQYGCGVSHEFTVADTGICGVCGKMSEVWDCELLAFYREERIPDYTVFEKFPRLRHSGSIRLQSPIYTRDQILSFITYRSDPSGQHTHFKTFWEYWIALNKGSVK